MNCRECGRPLHPMRDECDFCGADSPFARPNRLDLAVERSRAAAIGLLTQARGLRLAPPRSPRLAPRPGSTMPHLGRPSGRAITILGGVTLVALVALVFVLMPWGMSQSDLEAAQAELEAAQASAAASDAKQAELRTALDVARKRLSDTEAARGRMQAEVEARAASAETEVKALREQVTKSAAEAKSAKESATRAEQRIQSLSECLSGTTVALQFGRANSWGPADRALAAVSAACADARAPR